MDEFADIGQRLCGGLLLRAADFIDRQAVLGCGNRERHTALGVSPDGKRIVSRAQPSLGERSNNQVQMCEVTDGKRVWRSDDGASASTFTISPDGKLIGCIAKTEIRLLDAQTGRSIRAIDAGR
jgi:hypothetical protein